MPFASPEPHTGDLLPCDEQCWDEGSVGVNQPLFVKTVPADSGLNPFAATCQAAHLLGSVLRHRDEKGSDDREIILSEAHQLHRALSALSLHLTQHCFADTIALERGQFVALALCCSARFTLYEIYACNENYSSVGPRIAEEVSMQGISIEGIGSAVNDVYLLAECILRIASVSDQNSIYRLSPLLCHCLYSSISECAWLCRENHSDLRAAQLSTMISGLRSLGKMWKSAGMTIIL